MENYKSNRGLIGVVILLLIIIIGLSIYILYDKNNQDIDNTNYIIDDDITNNNLDDDNKTITLNALVGTYTWSSKYVGDDQVEYALKATLVINADGTATYEQSDGLVYEATRGTYIYENNQIIYTKNFYNYHGENGQDFDSEYSDVNSKSENFDVLNKDKLENHNVYHNKIVRLTK